MNTLALKSYFTSRKYDVPRTLCDIPYNFAAHSHEKSINTYPHILIFSSQGHYITCPSPGRTVTVFIPYRGLFTYTILSKHYAPYTDEHTFESDNITLDLILDNEVTNNTTLYFNNDLLQLALHYRSFILTSRKYFIISILAALFIIFALLFSASLTVNGILHHDTFRIAVNAPCTLINIIALTSFIRSTLLPSYKIYINRNSPDTVISLLRANSKHNNNKPINQQANDTPN